MGVKVGEEPFMKDVMMLWKEYVRSRKGVGSSVKFETLHFAHTSSLSQATIHYNGDSEKENFVMEWSLQ